MQKEKMRPGRKFMIYERNNYAETAKMLQALDEAVREGGGTGKWVVCNEGTLAALQRN